MAHDPDSARPLGLAEVEALMAPLGPFGPRPHLAVGVSGGPDSLALALLAGEWAAARGGRVTALTVDHGLRPEAADEARAVAGWMAAAGLAHETLTWAGPPPVTGVQAAARAARLGLLEDWCRRRGVLDLLLAHHRDDQGETVLQRLGQGSGPDGLAGMAPVSYRRLVRVLRPFLPVQGARTRATLRTRGRPWIEDPSNADPTYQRVRVRRLGPALDEAGVTASGLALAASRCAEVRAERDAGRNARLAGAVTLDPMGFAHVDMPALLAPPDSEARAALGRLLACVGGLPRPPRDAPLERLRCRLLGPEPAPAGMTLGRCHLTPCPGEPPGLWLVCREARHLPQSVDLRAGDSIHWDGRFRITLALDVAAPAPLVLAPLGEEGWRTVARRLDQAGGLGLRDAPARARPGLPALWRCDGTVCAVPHLRYTDQSICAGWPVQARFAPLVPMTVASARAVRRHLHGLSRGLCDIDDHSD